MGNEWESWEIKLNLKNGQSEFLHIPRDQFFTILAASIENETNLIRLVHKMEKLHFSINLLIPPHNISLFETLYYSTIIMLNL